MSRIAYVNGSYCPLNAAAVHVEDRGYQFADGVYEVIALRNGRMVDAQGHYDRLWRSMDQLKIDEPMTETAMRLVIDELVRRNRLPNALIYIQVTRGVAARDFKFPAGKPKPGLHQGSSIVITVRPAKLDHSSQLEQGVHVVTVPDLRWKRRDIKSVALLPQVLAKQAASEQGAFEAWMVDDEGFITEGSSSNAWIVTRDGKLVTRQAAGNMILRGVTRTSLLRFAELEGLEFEERAFKPEEAYQAVEAFVSSATTFLLPVVEIDGHAVGNGRPGSLGERLRNAYMRYADGHAGADSRWVA
ncbi:MAG: D-amino-acid transaminase [Pseudomonadota bacterium]